MVAANAALQERLLAVEPGPLRDPALDLAVGEAMLALSSDWAFMVTKDSAADYARRRAEVHTSRFDAVVAGKRPLPLEDRVFGHLDARLLTRE